MPLACHTYLESLCCKCHFGLPGTNLSAYYKVSKFGWQIAATFLHHLIWDYVLYDHHLIIVISFWNGDHDNYYNCYDFNIKPDMVTITGDSCNSGSISAHTGDAWTHLLFICLKYIWNISASNISPDSQPPARSAAQSLSWLVLVPQAVSEDWSSSGTPCSWSGRHCPCNNE